MRPWADTSPPGSSCSCSGASSAWPPCPPAGSIPWRIGQWIVALWRWGSSPRAVQILAARLLRERWRSISLGIWGSFRLGRSSLTLAVAARDAGLTRLRALRRGPGGATGRTPGQAPSLLPEGSAGGPGGRAGGPPLLADQDHGGSGIAPNQASLMLTTEPVWEERLRGALALVLLVGWSGPHRAGIGAAGAWGAFHLLHSHLPSAH